MLHNITLRLRIRLPSYAPMVAASNEAQDAPLSHQAEEGVSRHLVWMYRSSTTVSLFSRLSDIPTQEWLH